MIKMFGIKNCDTIKKARKWLEHHNVDYQFIDYRLDGLTAEQLSLFSQKLGWQNLLNSRGTTYRALPETTKTNLTETFALELMLQQPAMIKRPLLVHDNTYLLGFNIAQYQQLLDN
ncbi:ArsC family transcriptional regulator [Arsukibacterium sp. MJ3]|jgi:Spx/MgsR family transcriptional regulator|uniref:ArsC family reductase n=1 Tax=Arsukibacterium sp. MJ3 TaxID=1632859 RepID=UPI000626F35A|nr:ArsC family reductase [Arsukibacterium sp. MJ3]KKO49925.1 ArsC family transcriptional regulator [Arsukibacterium sp. MJ3]